MTNGTPARIMGNGEGFTTLILTSNEAIDVRTMLSVLGAVRVQDIFDRGIQRATDRIKAEFDEEQKRRKESKK